MKTYNPIVEYIIYQFLCKQSHFIWRRIYDTILNNIIMCRDPWPIYFIRNQQEVISEKCCKIFLNTFVSFKTVSKHCLITNNTCIYFRSL